MWQKRPHGGSSFKESIKVLEADIQHANALAAALPRDRNGDSIQMKLSYSPIAPFLLFIVEWMDYSCMDTLPSFLGLLHILVSKVPQVYVDGIPRLSSQERKASLREFYAVIYPSLKQLEADLLLLMDKDSWRYHSGENLIQTVLEDKRKPTCADLEGDLDECGICLENCPKTVLPNCGHSMCIACFQDWNSRSQSCPFCRDSLKRVSSGDLWVLVSQSDATDLITIVKENLRGFYLFLENLPCNVLETHSLVGEYLI